MWQNKDDKLVQTFSFEGFDEAVEFIEKVANIARGMDHHPTIINTYDTVEIQFSTHSQGNIVTEKDQLFAGRIDDLFKADVTPDSPHLHEAKLYTDGGSRGNPGQSATGYVILDMDDNVVKKDGVYLGITTNNQAEYQGLKTGLEACQKLGIRDVQVYMDSMLVVNQMNGLYKVKNRDLWPIHQSIKEMQSNFSKVTFSYVPRELNKIADSMVNECLDAEKGLATDGTIE